VVVPGLVLVVDDGGAQAPGRVDAGAGDGDGGQVHHEHGEADGEGSQNLQTNPKKINRSGSSIISKNVMATHQTPLVSGPRHRFFFLLLTRLDRRQAVQKASRFVTSPTVPDPHARKRGMQCCPSLAKVTAKFHLATHTHTL
jgi:hypothetical protein